MELTTLSRRFLPIDVIDEFESAIWTERYYGDSEVQLIVPATPTNLSKLGIGTFLSSSESNEVMILETHDIKDNRVTVSGISLLKWLNNRFIRATAAHGDRYWTVTGLPVGYVLWYVIEVMCVDGVHPGYPAGIPNPAELKISNIWATHVDMSGPNVVVDVPYGPIYDALNAIAVTHKIGMTITLDVATETTYFLGFRSYKGVDRTSGQTVNPLVRFSPEMESLSDIKEFQSIANHKTHVYTFAPSDPIDWFIGFGYATIYPMGNPGTEFDVRALMVFEEDITAEVVGTDDVYFNDLLDQRAREALEIHEFVKLVDGEIVATSQFKYGIDYKLGDIIEVQGHSGIVQTARVLEYIRSQDNTGEKAYPTLEMID